jgi:hypothetical protein
VAPGTGGVSAAQVLPAVPTIDRMVIKNASLSISVSDTSTTLSQVGQLVTVEGGTITSQTTRAQDEKTFANLVIQVPPDRFEDMLAKLRDLRASGTRVLNDAVNAQDVTEQFIDLDAQYRNLQATRDAYQKLLDKATAVSDIITLTREVSSIQTQMDQIQGRQNVLKRGAQWSNISLSLAPVGTSVAQPSSLPQPQQALGQAWNALLIGLRAVAVGLIWMAILLPLPALVLAIAWFSYRRIHRRPGYQPAGSNS